MIWLIIIVIFLGVVVAVMRVFSFLFDRKQILAEQRTEARIPTGWEGEHERFGKADATRNHAAN
jgi:hypothetical protein